MEGQGSLKWRKEVDCGGRLKKTGVEDGVVGQAEVGDKGTSIPFMYIHPLSVARS